MTDMNVSVSGHIRADTVAVMQTLSADGLGSWPNLQIGDISFHGERENFERLHAMLGDWLERGGNTSTILGGGA